MIKSLTSLDYQNSRKHVEIWKNNSLQRFFSNQQCHSGSGRTSPIINLFLLCHCIPIFTVLHKNLHNTCPPYNAINHVVDEESHLLHISKPVSVYLVSPIIISVFFLVLRDECTGCGAAEAELYCVASRSDSVLTAARVGFGHILRQVELSSLGNYFFPPYQEKYFPCSSHALFQ